ncbi:UDP-N-acetylmuramoyl-L-alanine--D-glutamate ligase [Salipaludibacillus keqinensis]|uniref:UDP-N-acetylmuramoylalanine--D-glutamate ligase n=1 Tax=Salipaludibacillus keqinensis TaxID=2045207 RepID=A0A323TDQ3_9BACI|nr:UDP-N-acetylmuramoyl-L-alanine--D-glutamate ligase [Salipaludibacillus keqinensis]PYZ93241.1 UDP-N-acetylmuramoyl-L-alanine--D-glutamate ligase [Salipaludibacillus keqinensis]
MKMIKKFTDKKVLVLGLAKSGTESAMLLHRLGANVTVNDRSPFEGNGQAQKLDEMGIRVVCGSHPEDLVDDSLDYLIKNPGIRYDHPLVEKAMNLQIPVFTEVELAYLISEADMIGITGSNGKTTTTTYVGHMLKGGEKEPLLAGNIGEVACGVAQHATAQHEMVVELSSFQLMGIDTFTPKIAILLNFVEAHLDYHGSMEEYIKAKKNIFKNQSDSDYLIYNADDAVVSDVVKSGRATLVPFSTKKQLSHGACIVDGWLTVFNEKLIKVDEMSLPGEHNISNALAAAAGALLAGADVKQVRHVLKTFSGVEHRLQFVSESDQRRFYNNSKATNVPATITALNAFKEPIVLIAGGLDRGLSFDDLIPSLAKHVSVIVTYGETKDKLAETAKQAGVPKAMTVDTLEEATKKAYESSKPNDVILLSPACASWDQFKTFEQRGETFVRMVEEITKEN